MKKIVAFVFMSAMLLTCQIAMAAAPLYAGGAEKMANRMYDIYNNYDPNICLRNFQSLGLNSDSDNPGVQYQTYLVSFGTTRDYAIIAMFCDRNSGAVMRAKVMWNPLNSHADRYSRDAIALTEMAIGITATEKDALWGNAKSYGKNNYAKGNVWCKAVQDNVHMRFLQSRADSITVTYSTTELW
ncbi:hypothetical protein [Selenomonas sp. ND2010]|uniref:hypothetical protein n=1 Tax=Selenomonas sp. ND2010 TaxID=1410618 RepID=UPI00051C7DC2|nr:hypothetical protein [Selenomonas sp. ND2010]